MKISLEQKEDTMGELKPSDPVSPRYPCVYIRGTDKAGLKVGQMVTITGEVVSHTERERKGDEGVSYDCEVECHELEAGKMESPKDKNDGKSYQERESSDEDEIEKGLQESEKNAKAKKDEAKNKNSNY